MRQLVISGIFLTAVIFMAASSIYQSRQSQRTLPNDDNGIFIGSGACIACHGYDTLGVASIDPMGNDVNVIDDWRSSMMANSAKDPFWKAKVSHEVLENPAYQQEIESTCTKCHAPMGHFGAMYNGATLYSMSDLEQDPLGLDGVSCGACHQQSEFALGADFSGALHFDTNRIIYGPYPFGFANSMIDEINYEPQFGEHISNADLCASCHTLITETIDENGQITGNTFVEQATYHEWLNSDYNVNDQSCQSCHFPQISGPVKLSTDRPGFMGRSPFGLHTMAGANTFMLQLLRDNINELGLEATVAQFDSTIAVTMRMLQEQTLDMELIVDSINRDTLFASVHLQNKAGHKFPSGYPSRRTFVQFLLLNANNDTLFRSGLIDENYEVEGHDAHFEPHYDVISDSGQVQIYEYVQGDADSLFTTILDRAAFGLKDNRLPPNGFKTTHTVYDTTLIIGNAVADLNFNWENGVEGSGADIVHYHVPLHGYMGAVNIQSRVYYQSLPPKWMEEIFSVSTPEIDTFKRMYYETDQTPVLIAEAVYDTSFSFPSGFGDLPSVEVLAYPNPSNGVLTISGLGRLFETLKIMSIEGKTITIYPINDQVTARITLPIEPGIYLIHLQPPHGQPRSFKILRQ